MGMGSYLGHSISYFKCWFILGFHEAENLFNPTISLTCHWVFHGIPWVGNSRRSYPFSASWCPNSSFHCLPIS
ncbi:hypothetical protein HK096_005353 [Nowakowskiella sp. JEL0078]|nr:hypothetical protein HK096_005353 [Nowakowskiella sp. JEL0078]